MQEKQEDLEKEIQYLKTKCNMQVDFIKSELDKYKKNQFIWLFSVFFDVVSEMLKENAFYESKKDTDISRKYRIVEGKILKEYIAKCVGGSDTRKILTGWADLALVAKDGNNQIMSNYTIDGRSVRSVRVSKAAVEYVKKESLAEVPVE